MSEQKLNKTQTETINKLSTKSGKIRYLASLEWSRGDIAKYLGIRYQHVRNVLITPVKNPKDQV